MLFYDPRAANPYLRTWSAVRRMRALKLDCVVLLTNSFRTALFARASGAPRRVGYSRAGRGLLLTEGVKPQRAGLRYLPLSAVDYYLGLAKALGCTPSSRKLELSTLPEDEQTRQIIFSDLNLPEDAPLVTFNGGAAFGPAKQWPLEYFAALGKRIAQEFDHRVLVLCGPKERERARQIARLAGDDRVVSLADQPLSIGITKSCVRHSRLLVTTDSGPRHFAAAFDVPVITLFGPTHIEWSETQFARAVHLQKLMPCGPCQQRECPLGHHRCMRELMPDEVFRAVANQLRPWETMRAA
jgi:heptosyltransferase-2